MTLGTPTSGTAELYIQLDGTVVPRINVPISGVTNPYVKEFEVQYALYGESPQQWLSAASARGDADSAYIYPVRSGESYDGRVRAITSLGNAGPWSYFYDHTVIGKTEVPADVTGFMVVAGDSSVIITCDKNTEADLERIEVRYSSSGGDTWETAAPLTNILRGNSSTSVALTAGTWYFWAKAFDTSGNESTTAASTSLTVNAPGTPAPSVLVVGGQYRLTWPEPTT